MLNDYQRAILRAYSSGDYLHREDEMDAARTPHALRRVLDSCGDTLLSFLMMEVDRSAPCRNWEAALMRLHMVKGDIELMIKAVGEARNSHGGESGEA